MKLTFGRIEASDLDYVITLRPFQFVHFLLGTQAAEFAHVVLQIPDDPVNIFRYREITITHQGSSSLFKPSSLHIV